jgi:hypothetical protein
LGISVTDARSHQALSDLIISICDCKSILLPEIGDGGYHGVAGMMITFFLTKPLASRRKKSSRPQAPPTGRLIQ